MLPKHWADGSEPPVVYSLPRDWTKLKGRYDGLAKATTLPPRAFDRTWAAVQEIKPTHALLEREYIDADFRDEFVNYYARTFRPLSDRCERIHFFRDDSYVGFVIMRPIPGRPVSRSIFWPPRSELANVTCITAQTAWIYGVRRNAKGFPFISQDARFGRCAHAAVWMVANYHHFRHATPRVHISDIARAAGTVGTSASIQPPSPGLTQPQMKTAWREMGFPVISYALSSLPVAENLEAIVCRYLNSRLPVMVATSQHTHVLIGFGRAKNGKYFFIKHDDAEGPYIRVKDWQREADPWLALLIPMPGRIYMTAESAEAYAFTAFEAAFKERSRVFQDVRAALTTDLRLRTYVVRAGEYKANLDRRGIAPFITGLHKRASTSQWIWVVEAQDRVAAAKSSRCVVGEVALDATSDPWTPSLLFGTLPGYAFHLPRLGGTINYTSDPGFVPGVADDPNALWETGTARHC